MADAVREPDLWTPEELATKIDWEGGVWEAYEFGVFRKRTNDIDINRLLGRLEDYLELVDSTWRELIEKLLLSEPGGGSD